VGGGFGYTRIYVDADGESRFEDVELALDGRLEAPPAEPLPMGSLGAARGVIVVRGDRGWGGEAPHPAPGRLLFAILSGTFAVTTSTGEHREFGPGAMVLVEDTSGRGHSTKLLDDASTAVVTQLA
jgi:hypothetical protein